MCLYVYACVYIQYVYVCVCMCMYSMCMYEYLLYAHIQLEQTFHITTNVPPSPLPHHPHIPTFTPHCHCRVPLVTAETRELE